MRSFKSQFSAAFREAFESEHYGLTVVCNDPAFNLIAQLVVKIGDGAGVYISDLVDVATSLGLSCVDDQRTITFDVEAQV